MDKAFVEERRDRILLELSLDMGASPDEDRIRQLKEISTEYARGYLEAFLRNASEADILFTYQVTRLVNMAR